MKHIKIGKIKIGNDLHFVLIAGQCAIESLDHAMFMCGELKKITDKLGIPFIYKSSFDKANRTSIESGRGVGLAEGITIFRRLKEEFDCAILTDVHEIKQIDFITSVVDVLQTPAFLCRQTDLLLACGKTGLVINVKKGQFLSPEEMTNIVNKIESTGNENIMLCERGTTFGYNNLVVDFRSIPIMKETGYPVVMDATHSVQKPGGQGTSSGGNREYVPLMAKAALVQGVAAVFMECHQDPDSAPSDGPNMIKLKDMENLLGELKAIDELVKYN